MPTLLILFRDKLSSGGVFWGVALAILFGLPLYLWGEMTQNINLKVGANIGILIISLVLPILADVMKRDKKTKEAH
jgi:hypothetical protein